MNFWNNNFFIYLGIKKNYNLPNIYSNAAVAAGKWIFLFYFLIQKDNYNCSSIGASIMKKGGNAIDATVAVW